MTYEYKIITIAPSQYKDEFVNKYGKDGWQLLHVQNAITGYGDKQLILTFQKEIN